MTRKKAKHLLSERMERWPVFGLELLTASRRRAERFKTFNRLFRSPLARIIIGVLIGAALLFFIGQATLGTPRRLFRGPLLIILGYVLVPIYACYTSLRRGAETLSSEAEERSCHEWVATGIPPAQIATEMVLARALLLLPVAVTLALIFCFTHLVVDVFGRFPTYFFFFDEVYYKFLSHSREVVFIFFALILVLYMFFFAAAYLGALVRSTAGRVALVFGYLVAHMVIPILLVIFISMTAWGSQSIGDSDFFLFSMIAVHPLGAFFHALQMYYDSTFSSAIDPFTGYAVSVIFQLLLAYFFYSLAVRAFSRKLVR